MKLSQILEYDITSYRRGDELDPRSPYYDGNDAIEDPIDLTPQFISQFQQKYGDVYDYDKQPGKDGGTVFTGAFATAEGAQAMAEMIKKQTYAADPVFSTEDMGEEGMVYNLTIEYTLTP